MKPWKKIRKVWEKLQSLLATFLEKLLADNILMRRCRMSKLKISKLECRGPGKHRFSSFCTTYGIKVYLFNGIQVKFTLRYYTRQVDAAFFLLSKRDIRRDLIQPYSKT